MRFAAFQRTALELTLIQLRYASSKKDTQCPELRSKLQGRGLVAPFEMQRQSVIYTDKYLPVNQFMLTSVFHFHFHFYFHSQFIFFPSI